jgi:hypothetical protein
MKENIIKFLEGKYSLGHSYWVVGVLGSIGVGIPLILIAVSDVDNMTGFIATLAIIYYFFYLLYCVGVLIGTWRSAGFYIQQKLKSKQSAIWGYTARVALVLGAASILSEIIKLFK